MRTGTLFVVTTFVALLAVEGARADEAIVSEVPASPPSAENDPSPPASMSPAPLPPPPPSPPKGTTIHFPYEQQRLLMPYDANGGLAYVTLGARRGAELPVVVFLHGMNAGGMMHMGFAAPFTDLRTVVDALVGAGRVPPLVLAAPSHTRGAFAARRMWPDFDLEDFLTSTEAALAGAAKLDRARVIVVAHSGGACNPGGGGIFAPSVRRLAPRAVIAVDTCLYEDVIPALASLAAAVPLRFYWQKAWSRPVDALAGACPSCAIEELTDLPQKPSPHLTILPEAIERSLPEVLAVE